MQKQKIDKDNQVDKQPICLIVSNKISVKNTESNQKKRFMFSSYYNGNVFFNQYPNRFF